MTENMVQEGKWYDDASGDMEELFGEAYQDFLECLSEPSPPSHISPYGEYLLDQKGKDYLLSQVNDWLGGNDYPIEAVDVEPSIDAPEERYRWKFSNGEQF